MKGRHMARRVGFLSCRVRVQGITLMLSLLLAGCGPWKQVPVDQSILTDRDSDYILPVKQQKYWEEKSAFHQSIWNSRSFALNFQICNFRISIECHSHASSYLLVVEGFVYCRAGLKIESNSQTKHPPVGQVRRVPTYVLNTEGRICSPIFMTCL